MHFAPEELNQLFLIREKESTTVLNPDLAIPHIVIDGEHEFDILLARSKEGIYFSETAPAVHTIFLLVGTKDERPFHLRALAAIAQICQRREFDNIWLSARNIEELRDIILLAERKRFSTI